MPAQIIKRFVHILSAHLRCIWRDKLASILNQRNNMPFSAAACPWPRHYEMPVLPARQYPSYRHAFKQEHNCIRRRRRCMACDKRFSTMESVEMRMPLIIKRTGEKVLFDPAKLHTSLNRALHKRPIDSETVEDTIAAIESRLYHLGVKEISSQAIGEMMLDELALLDEVAYVRFASVYKSFHDVSEFTQLIASLNKK